MYDNLNILNFSVNSLPENPYLRPAEEVKSTEEVLNGQKKNSFFWNS